MSLHWIDLSIAALSLVILFAVGAITKRYTVSVADFLAANRCAGRYMLTMAMSAAAIGVVAFISYWEMFYKAGFNGLWWMKVFIPLNMIIVLSGWIVYRYRQTRAMTMAQFFEMRYSRRFRIFAGILTWVSGVINYGIFPAISCRALIYVFKVPSHFVEVGPFDINLTLAAFMFFFLGSALIFTFWGGQVAIMLTDFLAGQFFNISFLAILLFLFFTIGWDNISDVLRDVPEGKSLINPYDQWQTEDFNPWFYFMRAILIIYGFKAWQGTQGYNCAAKSAHEAKMANILATWREHLFLLLVSFAPIAIYTVMNGSGFIEQQAAINEVLNNMPDEQVRIQMLVPAALTELLPVGILGLLIATFISATITTDDTYLHSWGSIFIQDVYMPLKKKKISQEKHLKYLKFSILGVAVFAFFFSLIFPLKEYVSMFFQITGAIYLGGAGCIIIGGLYWKRATTAGAFAGMITGCVLAVSGIVTINIIWPFVLPDLKEQFANVQWIVNLPEEFWFNSMQISFFTAIIASLAYVVVSLLTKPDPDFEMDKMLHRGKYEVESDKAVGTEQQIHPVLKKLGITREFTFKDKLVYFGSIMITLFWFISFVVGTILEFTVGLSDQAWLNFWFTIVWIAFGLGAFVTVWFLIGGVRDSFDLIKALRSAIRNEADDGSVVDHHNLADETVEVSLSDDSQKK